MSFPIVSNPLSSSNPLLGFEALISKVRVVDSTPFSCSKNLEVTIDFHVRSAFPEHAEKLVGCKSSISEPQRFERIGTHTNFLSHTWTIPLLDELSESEGVHVASSLYITKVVYIEKPPEKKEFTSLVCWQVVAEIGSKVLNKHCDLENETKDLEIMRSMLSTNAKTHGATYLVNQTLKVSPNTLRDVESLSILDPFYAFNIPNVWRRDTAKFVIMAADKFF